MSMHHKANETLILRGIITVANSANWKAASYRNAWGWTFPIYNLDGVENGTRWKAMNNDHATIAGRKYAWLPNKPQNDDADWYLLPDTKDAIADAGGVAYLANGEPALLSYRSANIDNVIATTLSEIGIPSNVTGMLEQLGVNALYYPVDNDEAGRQSAIRWRDALADSPVYFEAQSWGDAVPEKGDANDLWIQVKFSPNAFSSTLHTLSPLDLPPRQIRESSPYTEQSYDGQKLADAIASRVGVLGQATDSGGFYKRKITCPNPAHTDRHASASVSAETGLVMCFSQCGKLAPFTVAEYLGLRLDDYRNQTPHKTTRTHWQDNSDLAYPVPTRAVALDRVHILIDAITELIVNNPNPLDYITTQQDVGDLSACLSLRKRLLSSDPVPTNAGQFLSKLEEQYKI